MHKFTSHFRKVLCRAQRPVIFCYFHDKELAHAAIVSKNIRLGIQQKGGTKRSSSSSGEDLKFSKFRCCPAFDARCYASVCLFALQTKLRGHSDWSHWSASSLWISYCFPFPGWSGEVLFICGLPGVGWGGGGGENIKPIHGTNPRLYGRYFFPEKREPNER